jgi:GT2 family glycosyltransferase
MPALAVAAGPTVSVVICCYTERRFGLLRAAVDSALRQTRPPEELIVVVDHAPALLRRARAELGDEVAVIANDGDQGLADARNAGVRAAAMDVVAFLDDDACADEDWLERLTEVFADPGVIGAGGTVDPDWAAGEPRWLPPEFWWTVGCSYTGLPRRQMAIRNPIGANMSFRRRVLVGEGFRVGVGRVGTLPMGCEETEFAIRATQREPGARVLHVPDARVTHAVPADRASWRYFVSRCWAEGRSKAIVASLIGASDGLSSERDYVVRALPAGVGRGLRDAARGDAGGLGRALAIVLGLGVTAAGYLRGRAVRPD